MARDGRTRIIRLGQFKTSTNRQPRLRPSPTHLPPSSSHPASPAAGSIAPCQVSGIIGLLVKATSIGRNRPKMVARKGRRSSGLTMMFSARTSGQGKVEKRALMLSNEGVSSSFVSCLFLSFGNCRGPLARAPALLLAAYLRRCRRRWRLRTRGLFTTVVVW